MMNLFWHILKLIFLVFCWECIKLCSSWRLVCNFPNFFLSYSDFFQSTFSAFILLFIPSRQFSFSYSTILALFTCEKLRFCGYPFECLHVEARRESGVLSSDAVQWCCDRTSHWSGTWLQLGLTGITVNTGSSLSAQHYH